MGHDPLWGQLDDVVQARLLAADRPFLVCQLTNERYRVIVVKGRTAMHWVERAVLVCGQRRRDRMLRFVLSGHQTSDCGGYSSRRGSSPVLLSAHGASVSRGSEMPSLARKHERAGRRPVRVPTRLKTRA